MVVVTFLNFILCVLYNVHRCIYYMYSYIQLYTMLFKCRVKEKDNLDPEKLTHVKEEVQKDFYIYFFMNYQ